MTKLMMGHKFFNYLLDNINMYSQLHKFINVELSEVLTKQIW